MGSDVDREFGDVPAKLCARCGAVVPRKVLPSGRLEKPAFYARRKYCGGGCAQTKNTGALLAEIAKHLGEGADCIPIPGAQAPVVMRRRRILWLIRQAHDRGEPRPSVDQLARQCGVTSRMIRHDRLDLQRGGAWPELTEVERERIALARRQQKRRVSREVSLPSDSARIKDMLLAFREAAASYEAVRTLGTRETDRAHDVLRTWVFRCSRIVGASKCRYRGWSYLPLYVENSFMRVRASKHLVPLVASELDRDEEDAKFDAAHPGLVS